MTIRTRRRLFVLSILSALALAAWAIPGTPGNEAREAVALGAAALLAWVACEVSPTDRDARLWRSAR